MHMSRLAVSPSAPAPPSVAPEPEHKKARVVELHSSVAANHLSSI